MDTTSRQTGLTCNFEAGRVTGGTRRLAAHGDLRNRVVAGAWPAAVHTLNRPLGTNGGGPGARHHTVSKASGANAAEDTHRDRRCCLRRKRKGR